MIMFPAAIVMMDDEDNRSFMEQLYIQHRYLLFKVAYDTVGDPQIAEDMVSEACMLFIENIEILRKLNICKQRAYIVSTIKHVSVDYVRKRNSQGRRQFFVGEEKAFDIPEQDQMEDELIRQAEGQAIRQALKKIHRSERDLLQMKYFDLMSDAEIAERLHIAKNSVRYYLTKARRSLKSILEKEEFL